MRGIGLMAAALLAACGGGGGAPAPAVTFPPPPIVYEDVSGEFDTAYDDEIAAYETTALNRERELNANSQWGTPGHYQLFVEDVMTHTNQWADAARSIVASAEAAGNVDYNAVSDLIEDYRLMFMDYMLASYEYLHSRAGQREYVYTSNRTNLINGINAIFDQLQTDV